MSSSHNSVGDTPGYDVIGDVHGHVEQLEALLRQMDYIESNGTWRHPTRTAVLVGDIIDRRRDHQLDTLRVVRKMVDAGSARIVLGNHEFNAVAYATVDPTRWDYCRPHSAKNHKQHREFLEELDFDSPLHRSMIDWFREIPLWLDLGGLRVVHACWSSADIAHLESILDPSPNGPTLNDQAVIDGTTNGTDTYRAIENVLKGPETPMNGCWYFDKGGVQRKRARVAWWNGDATTLPDGAVVPDGTQLHDATGNPIVHLPDDPLPDNVPRYTGDVPVVFGHYWRSGELRTEGPMTACVDYSAGKGGPLVAYRWGGETKLTVDRLVSC